MTHTLHREGSVESLKNDYLLLITPAMGYNDEGAAEKIRKLIDIVFDVGPINYGCYELGKNILSDKIDIDVIKDETRDNSRIRCVFNSKEKFKEVIKRVVEEDLGLSVTLSALQEPIEDILKELNIDPHSVNNSLGVVGDLDKLPDENFRKITTMCGHAMVSSHLVKDLLLKIKKDRMSVEKASVELAKPCLCGIFNQERAAILLEEFLPIYTVESLENSLYNR